MADALRFLRRPAAAAFLLALAVAALPVGTAAEPASQPGSVQAAGLDLGGAHSCAVVGDGDLRCWGFGRDGQLGYGNRNTVGDNEPPASVPPVDLGVGSRVTAISAGDFHTCALLEGGTVRCWGFGGNGRLGLGRAASIGDDEPPAFVGPVDLGPGQTAAAIAAGGSHTCALLADGSVRCWGYGGHGQLGYPGAGAAGQPEDIGDDESPGSVGPVDLGPGRKARAITAGDLHTCALLDSGGVLCWGSGTNGQLGYAATSLVGDDETPASVGPVDLGGDRTAVALSAGTAQTCAVLDDGSVRCWGFGGNGRLGYGNRSTVGDDETPGSVGPVDLGAGQTAVAIGVGDGHACALLAGGGVRCWGLATSGQLGYAGMAAIGDDEAPGAIGPVALGAGRMATAIALGARHTCARLDDGNVRCWGAGASGRLGYCGERNIGDDETPAAAGPVALGPPLAAGSACPLAVAAPAPPAVGITRGLESPDPLRFEAVRRRNLRRCLAGVTRHARRESGRARRLSGSRRVRARRHARRHARQLRRRCVKRWGRTPGPVEELRAHAPSRTTVVLTFLAPGTDGSRPPVARTYLVKQSRRPIRGARGFRRAPALCDGRCRFPSLHRVGSKATLTVEDLRPRTSYHYAVAARDNVSGRLGPRSRSVSAATR